MRSCIRKVERHCSRRFGERGWHVPGTETWLHLPEPLVIFWRQASMRHIVLPVLEAKTFASLLAQGDSVVKNGGQRAVSLGIGSSCLRGVEQHRTRLIDK